MRPNPTLHRARPRPRRPRFHLFFPCVDKPDETERKRTINDLRLGLTDLNRACPAKISLAWGRGIKGEGETFQTTLHLGLWALDIPARTFRNPRSELRIQGFVIRALSVHSSLGSHGP